MKENKGRGGGGEVKRKRKKTWRKKNWEKKIKNEMSGREKRQERERMENWKVQTLIISIKRYWFLTLKYCNT